MDGWSGPRRISCASLVKKVLSLYRFLEAVITTCGAMKICSERYAAATQEMAANTGIPQRKKELLNDCQLNRTRR